MRRIFEFFQLLSRRVNDSPRQFCQIAKNAARPTRFVTRNFRTRSRCSMVQVWMSGFRAFLDELFAASL